VNDLCAYEIDVLRVCAGEQVPGMQWGAAMGQALECLECAGLVARSGGAYAATDKGRSYLAMTEDT